MSCLDSKATRTVSCPKEERRRVDSAGTRPLGGVYEEDDGSSRGDGYNGKFDPPADLMCFPPPLSLSSVAVVWWKREREIERGQRVREISKSEENGIRGAGTSRKPGK
ncbi:hypothetical protein TB2_023749 [Malus domestica]